MRLRSKLLAAAAALGLTVLGSVGLAGASDELPAGDYAIDVPGVGTVTFTVDAEGDASVTALPDGFQLAADEEVEVEDLPLIADGTVYEVQFEAENDDEGLTAEIEAEAAEDDEDEAEEEDEVEDDETEADEEVEEEVETDEDDEANDDKQDDGDDQDDDGDDQDDDGDDQDDDGDDQDDDGDDEADEEREDEEDEEDEDDD